MKKKSLLVIIFASLSMLLSSCAFDGGDSSNSSSSSGTDITSNSDTSDSSSSDTSTYEEPVLTDTKITIYATNDIHGQIYPENPELSDGNGRIGLGKLMTFLKDKKEGHEEVFLLDQGDTWQGGIYSNYNHGKLINDVMSYVRYDARTVGNHDFDWGLEAIRTNTARSYDGYLMPTLAANVYDYNFDTHTTGTTQQSDIGRTSVTRTLSNGLKVGIVGVIGKSQITSINSLYTHDITFTDHIAVAKAEATKLKNEGCHIVILSIHGGQGDVINEDLSDYFDLVLCGHTHQNEWTVENGMPIMQFGEYTRYVGEISLNYDVETNSVTADVEPHVYKSNDINTAVSTVDSTIQGLIDTYATQCDEEGSEVLVQDAFGSFGASGAAEKLMARAIYDQAILEEFDIDFAYCNKARHDLGTTSQHTTWTYSDIYQAFPFDNTVYIFEITLDEIVTEVKAWNSICKADGELNLELGHTYTIACIDFLAFHTNDSRDYDWFPSIGSYTVNEMDKLSMNYREILRNWFKRNHYNDSSYDLTLNYSNYQNSVSAHNKNQLIMPNCTITFNNNYSGAVEPFATGSARYGNSYSAAYPDDEPTRDGYGFDGWYLEPECINLANYETIKGNATLYAKWKDSKIYSSSYFNFNYLNRNIFVPLDEPASSNFDAPVTNALHDEKTMAVTYSNSCLNADSRSIILEAGGYYTFTAPSGTKIYSVKVMQFKYHNIKMYAGTSVNDSNRINVGYSSTTYQGYEACYYEYNGNTLDSILVYNSYSNYIRLFFIQVDLIVV